MFKYLLIILIQWLITHKSEVNAQNILQDKILEPVVNELYLLYKDAYEKEKPYATRRLFTNENYYKLHVQKLKEVNGLKTHNLKIESMRSKPPWESLIYIINPVEAHLPNAFISVEEFKKIASDRIEKQKQQFNRHTISLIQANEYFKAHRPQTTEDFDQAIKNISDIIIQAIGTQVPRNTKTTNKDYSGITMIMSVSHTNLKEPKTKERSKPTRTHMKKAKTSLNEMNKKIIRHNVNITSTTLSNTLVIIPEKNKRTLEMKPNIRTTSRTTTENTHMDATVYYTKSIPMKSSTEPAMNDTSEIFTIKPTNKLFTIPEENKTTLETNTGIIKNNTEMINTAMDATVHYTETVSNNKPSMNATTKMVTLNGTSIPPTSEEVSSEKPTLEMKTNIITNRTDTTVISVKPTMKVITEMVTINDKSMQPSSEDVYSKEKTMEVHTTNSTKLTKNDDTDSTATVISAKPTINVTTETVTINDTSIQPTSEEVFSEKTTLEVNATLIKNSAETTKYVDVDSTATTTSAEPTINFKTKKIAKKRFKVNSRDRAWKRKTEATKPTTKVTVTKSTRRRNSRPYVFMG